MLLIGVNMNWLLLNIILIPLMLFAAKISFEDGNKKMGYFDLFAAALNVLVVIMHFTN
jgi:hypothetical protein